MDTLNLVNYIAIACLDLGILGLYYILEWYQIRYHSDVHNTKSSSLEASTKTTSYSPEDKKISIDLIDSLP